MIYEWDETKRATNLEKHGLDFVDAELVLESEYVLIVDSPRRGELRQQAFAYVFEVLSVLSVAFVPGEEHCRIVSFRPARRDERRVYHEWLENHFDD
ncbi:BrnT family toxin [Paraburkholderia sp. A3RO-2L]|uniref:BrnT family toxin n=1 Tax=Paraburkholderia sp. A3RO-2L TaxID=3028376 RepID=UPI003DA98001